MYVEGRGGGTLHYLRLNVMGLPRWNRILTQVGVHPQLSHNSHPVDGGLLGDG
jgi:hypothetical protein